MSPRKMRAALGRQEWFTKEASKKIPDKVLSFKGGDSDWRGAHWCTFGFGEALAAYQCAKDGKNLFKIV